MKITIENTLREFQAWSGAVGTKNTIISLGLEEQFEELIDECYPNGLTATELNDILWFDSEWIFECLGIEEE